jgi:hypothetical protein
MRRRNARIVPLNSAGSCGTIDRTAKSGEGEFSYVEAVERHPTAGHVPKTGEQRGDRCLASARRSDQRHHLARSDAEADLAQNVGKLCAISKAHPLEHDFTPHASAEPTWLRRFGDGRLYIVRSSKIRVAAPTASW